MNPCQNSRVSWRASSHAKYDCKYHLVWCPKRRRVLGDPDVRAYVTKRFLAIAEEFGFWIDELAIEDAMYTCSLSSRPNAPSRGWWGS